MLQLLRPDGFVKKLNELAFYFLGRRKGSSKRDQKRTQGQLEGGCKG